LSADELPVAAEVSPTFVKSSLVPLSAGLVATIARGRAAYLVGTLFFSSSMAEATLG
jgi:hypothetical protein